MKKCILVLLLMFCFICSMGVVSAHEGMENPIVTIDDLKPGDNVSDTVDFKITVHEHNEMSYVNVTAEHMETRTKYLNKQDNNPSDGWSVSWDTSNAPNGEYWITVKAVDVKGLEGKSEMKLILNNIHKESKIVLENPTTVVNKSTNVIANLMDSNSNPLNDKFVEFVIGGESYSTKTTSAGIATITFTPKEVRNYDLIVKFEGDNKYLKSQTSGVVKVISNINATIITVDDIAGNNKEKIILKANLICPGLYDANINKNIDFYVNGIFIGSNYTNENGDAIFYYTISESGGTYIYQAKYQNESGANFTDSATLYVPQSEVYMTMNAVTYSIDGIFTIGNMFKLNFIVNNNGPDNAKNTVVRYNIPQALKYIESKTSKGNVVINSNNLIWNIGDVQMGSENIEIKFEILSAGRISLSPSISTDTYDESINNAVPTRFLTVNSYNLKGNDLTKYFGGSNKYKVYLLTGDGKPVVGANIKISINKQIINLKTNDKGFVELAINLKSGKYTVKVTCNKLSLSNKITIKPTLITKNISKKRAKKIKFTAKLLNNNGKILKNKKIVFKLKGKKYIAKTNKKGIAIVMLKNLNVGKYIVQTSYGKSLVKNTIRIKK